MLVLCFIPPKEDFVLPEWAVENGEEKEYEDEQNLCSPRLVELLHQLGEERKQDYSSV